ncbi:acetyltransferase, partial [Georgenia sp. MJ170]|uniref:PglD-related sugar-binding protein n=1 Tax=Georgenia sunbinii TaxID=3117728 RepID=UPI002F2611B1
MTETQLVIVGASGAGRRLVDIALDMMDNQSGAPFCTVVVVDDNPSATNLNRLQAQGVPFLGASAEWLAHNKPTYFSIGIGDTRARRRLALQFISQGHTPATLIAPTARISRTARVAAGAVISPGVDISTNVTIGAYSHVMANAAVSHDATVGDYCNINPGAVLAGEVTVGYHSTVGAGATVL